MWAKQIGAARGLPLLRARIDAPQADLVDGRPALARESYARAPALPTHFAAAEQTDALAVKQSEFHWSGSCHAVARDLRLHYLR